MSGISYFAYISSSKVSQLYAQLGGMADETKRFSNAITRKGEGNLGFSILSAIVPGITFGREDEKTYEIEGKVALVNMLKDVVEKIQKTETVLSINQISDTEDITGAFCYHFRGEFRVETGYEMNFADKSSSEGFAAGDRFFNNKFVTIVSRIRKHRLCLACSLNNFANMGENVGADGKTAIVPHSGNYFFFSGSVSANFEGLMFLSGRKDNLIFGSPIYLIYTSDKQSLFF